jgi:hypothetical protein
MRISVVGLGKMELLHAGIAYMALAESHSA